MEAPSAGSVVLVPFPFSDLSESKLRPAVILAEISTGGAIKKAACYGKTGTFVAPTAVECLSDDSQSPHRSAGWAPNRVWSDDGENFRDSEVDSMLIQ